MHNKADPNTMLRIAVSFILYKAGLQISPFKGTPTVSPVTISCECQNLCHCLVQGRTVEMYFFALSMQRQITSPHNQFSDQNSATKGRGSPTFLVPTFHSRRLVNIRSTALHHPINQTTSRVATDQALLTRRCHCVFRDLFQNLNRAIQTPLFLSL